MEWLLIGGLVLWLYYQQQSASTSSAPATTTASNAVLSTAVPATPVAPLTTTTTPYVSTTPSTVTTATPAAIAGSSGPAPTVTIQPGSPSPAVAVPVTPTASSAVPSPASSNPVPATGDPNALTNSNSNYMATVCNPYANCTTASDGSVTCPAPTGDGYYSVVVDPTVGAAPPAFLDPDGNIIFYIPYIAGYYRLLAPDGSWQTGNGTDIPPVNAGTITSVTQITAPQLASWEGVTPALDYPNPPLPAYCGSGVSGLGAMRGVLLRRSRWAA